MFKKSLFRNQKKKLRRGSLYPENMSELQYLRFKDSHGYAPKANPYKKMVFNEPKKRTNSLIKVFDYIISRFKKIGVNIISNERFDKPYEDYLYKAWSYDGCFLRKAVLQYNKKRIIILASVFGEDHRDHHGEGKANIICNYQIIFKLKENTNCKKDYISITTGGKHKEEDIQKGIDWIIPKIKDTFSIIEKLKKE
jgi:hypothetical protein